MFAGKGNQGAGGARHPSPVGSARDFGDVFLALALWRMLQLDEFFARELPAGRADVPWALMACVLSVARFVEPGSELHIEDTWYRRTALPELLGVAVEQVNDSRLYRTLDAVLPLKSETRSAPANRGWASCSRPIWRSCCTT